MRRKPINKSMQFNKEDAEIWVCIKCQENITQQQYLSMVKWSLITQILGQEINFLKQPGIIQIIIVTTIILFLSAKRKKNLLLGSSTLFLEKQKCVDIITITFHHSSVLLRENRDNLFSKPLGNMIYIPNFRKHTTSIKKVIFHTFLENMKENSKQVQKRESGSGLGYY